MNNTEQSKMTSTFETTLGNDKQKLKSLGITYTTFIQGVKMYNPNIEEDLEIIYKILQKSHINSALHRFEDFIEILEYMIKNIKY